MHCRILEHFACALWKGKNRDTTIWHGGSRAIRCAQIMNLPVMNANENIPVVTWNPAPQWLCSFWSECTGLRYVLLQVKFSLWCAFFSLVVLLEYFAFGSSIYFEFDLHLFLICYLFMKLWLHDMTILFLFLHCSLFSSGFQKGAGKMQWLYVLLQ